MYGPDDDPSELEEPTEWRDQFDDQVALPAEVDQMDEGLGEDESDNDANSKPFSRLSYRFIARDREAEVPLRSLLNSAYFIGRDLNASFLASTDSDSGDSDFQPNPPCSSSTNNHLNRPSFFLETSTVDSSNEADISFLASFFPSLRRSTVLRELERHAYDPRETTKALHQITDGRYRSSVVSTQPVSSSATAGPKKPVRDPNNPFLSTAHRRRSPLFISSFPERLSGSTSDSLSPVVPSAPPPIVSASASALAQQYPLSDSRSNNFSPI
jgi:hypothetical protein